MTITIYQYDEAPLILEDATICSEGNDIIVTSPTDGKMIVNVDDIMHFSGTR